MKLDEALEVHEELNPKLWNNTELKEDVKNKLLEIANTFIEGLDFPLNVADIRFLGSNASYNYNEHSDIDLHIISNFDLVYIDKDILQQLYNASKNTFNNNHDITIKGIPVELYIEDMNSMNATNGSYSLLKDEWVKVPEPINYDIPDYSEDLQEKVNEVEEVLLSTSKEEVENLINEIYLDRKDGLATEGEASIGNLVFKELRNMDLIQRLRDRFNELESEELTLENKSAKLESQSAKFALKEDIEEDASIDGQITQKEKEYREYIDTHIANVKKAYDRIVKDLIKDEFNEDQITEIESNLECHDEDKNIPFIFDAYRRNHYPINDREKENASDDYDIAWSYHKTHNPHHWEYWLGGDGDFVADPVENAVKIAYVEMFCDWLSFGFRKEATSATGESTEFKVWYEDNKDNIQIHPDLKEWYDDKIDKIISYIDENKDTIFNKDVEIEEESKNSLTKVENYRIIEKENVNINKKEGEKEMNKLQEDYNEFKKDNKFTFDFNVIVPLEMKQEDDFSTYEDEHGNDIEMDYDIDSLYESFEEAENVINKWFNNEDFLKEVFPSVGLGRVYPYLISLEEDKLEFDIGFSDIQDPVEKGNEINLNESELKEQISDLVYAVLDEIGFLNASQYYDEYSGYTDEDNDPIYDRQYDDDISFSLNINGDIQIKENLTESNKLEESNLSRIFSHYQNTPFLVISAERPQKDNETEEQAKKRNKNNTLSLKNDIRSYGFGFIPVDGGWKEDGQVSYEASFFVPMSKGNFEDFFKIAIDLCNKYEQYAVLVSDGQGNIAYYDKSGNKDMEFKGGVSFNQNTIDSNIENAGGVGGYTSLNRKNPNKSFQLQEDLIQYKNHSQREQSFNNKYSDKVKIEESDTNYDILSKYKDADYGYIHDNDLKFIVETLYGKGTNLNEGINDYGDLQLEYERGRILNIQKN